MPTAPRPSRIGHLTQTFQQRAGQRQRIGVAGRGQFRLPQGQIRQVVNGWLISEDEDTSTTPG